MTSLIINPPSSALIPTITASVSPSTAVVVGSTITVDWTSTDTAVMNVTGLVTSTLITGQAIATAPSTPGTYLITFTATSSTNDVTPKVISIAVSSTSAIIPQIIVSASPSGTVAPGAAVKFSWNVTNATSATIVGTGLGINSTTLLDSATVNAPTVAGNTYSLLVTATSSTGDVATKSISITIDNVPSVNGSFSPYTVSPNDVTTLTWNSVNAASLSLSGLGIASISPSGSTSITAPNTLGIQSVNWTAKTQSGTPSVGKFNLNIVAAPVVTPNIRGSFAKSSMTTAETTTFTWSTTNATNVLVSGLVGSTLSSGTLNVPAQSAPGTYTVVVTATNNTSTPNGTATASFTLTVIAITPITPTFNGSFTPGTVKVGDTSTLNWSGTDLATLKLVNTALGINQTYINQTTGTLTITAPNNVSTQLVTYTATSSTNNVVTGTIPLIIQQVVIIPSVTGSFDVIAPLPNQTTTLTFVPVNAVSVMLNSTPLAITDSYAVTSGTSYTKSVTAPSTPGTYTVSMTATSSSGDNRSATAAFTVAAIVPTISASFDVTSPHPNDLTVLSWTATNASTITIQSTQLNLNLSFTTSDKFSVVAPATLQQYSVTVTATSATNTTISTVATFTVTQVPVIPTVTGSFSPAMVNPGQSTVLTWNTTDASSMDITGDVTSKSLTGLLAVVVSPYAGIGKKTTSYTATSTTGNKVTGTWVYEIVAVPPVIPSVTGSFSPSTVEVNKPTTFTWSSTNATTIEFTGAINSTTTQPNGDQIITPTQIGTQTVYYKATSTTGHTDVGSAVVSVFTPVVITVNGSFSPSTVEVNKPTTFTWSSTNATTIEFTGAINSTTTQPNGDQIITPTQIGTQTVYYKATNITNSVVTGTLSGMFTVIVTAVVVPITPSVTGSFSPSPVEAGKPTTFTWSSTDASSLLLSGAVSSTALSGTQSITPTQAGTQTVSYTATSSTNTVATGAVSLTVNAATPITPTVSGSFSPASITLGQTTTLTWSSTNATALSLTGAVTNNQLSGTSSITPNTTGIKTVNYTAASGTGTVITGSFNVAVSPAAPITPVVNGSFSPLSITLGQTTTLTWTSTNATTLALSGAVTSDQLNGSSSIVPTTTGTKTVNYTATSSTGTTTTGNFVFAVNAVTPIYPTVNDAGTYWSQYSVTPGQQNTLTWKIDNAVSASISGLVTSSAVSGSATITVPTTPGVYSAYMDATSSTGHKLQAGSDGKLPRHTDLLVVAAAALKGSMNSPAALSSKQQRQIVITGDATAGTQNYTVTLSTGAVDTTTGSPLTGTISNNSLTICLKGTNSAGTAQLTLTKTGYTNYTGSVAYAANTKYSPYLLTAGFPQESGFTAGTTTHTIATWIANNLYKGIATAYTTTLGTRYGLGRAPDYGGLVFWTNKCIATYAGNYSGSAFLTEFFGAAGGTDLTNSKTTSKTYNPGSGYSDFYDRPN